MTFATRLSLFAILALAAVVAWQWHAGAEDTRDLTELALRQFHSDGAVAGRLQDASLAANYWPLIWPASIVALGLVMFWDDLERCWKQQEN
jgi:hypothetical protein